LEVLPQVGRGADGREDWFKVNSMNVLKFGRVPFSKTEN
jgi:hypothetical protein